MNILLILILGNCWLSRWWWHAPCGIVVTLSSGLLPACSYMLSNGIVKGIVLSGRWVSRDRRLWTRLR